MLGRIHFYLGFLIVVIFLLTGQYMDRYYNHLADMESMSRALFRAGHLYILLFGLINIILGTYFRISQHELIRFFQFLGSLIIVTACVLLISSFFIELPAEQIERPMARWSLYLVLGGVLMHSLGGFGSRQAGS